MKLTTVAQSNTNISLRGERVVVAGGTQGIGEGVARRFAKAGAEVGIVGRNEGKGASLNCEPIVTKLTFHGTASAVLTKLKEISKEQNIDPPPEHYFIKADLSLVAEAKRVAESIRTRGNSVDYLVMTQGGPPNGKFVPTSETYDQHFGVQVLSRFVLAHELASNPASSTIQKGVISIMAPGKPMTAVDIDDIDMSKANERGTYSIWRAMSRDSVIVDAFTKELETQNPKVTFTHVFPGFVQTDTASNSNVPWYLRLVANVAHTLAGKTPEQYGEIPFYLLANPEGRALAAKDMFLDDNVAKVEPSSSAMDNNERAKIWEGLVEMTKLKN